MFALLLLLSAQIDHRFPAQHIEGILEVPEVFGEYACERYEPQRVTVYAEPSDSTEIGALELLRQWYLTESSPCEAIEVGFRSLGSPEAERIEFREYGYGEAGLIVVERRDDWFRIKLSSNSGWVRSQAAERFHSYPQLVSERLAYVNRGWSGLMWTAPGIGIPREVPEAWRPYTTEELTVEVLEARAVDGHLWFRIRLDAEYWCGDSAETLPIEGGYPGTGTRTRTSYGSTREGANLC